MHDLAQLTNAALALPVDQRILLAQELWASIPPALPNELDPETLAWCLEAERREAEIESGAEVEIDFDDAMAQLRKQLKCK